MLGVRSAPPGSKESLSAQDHPPPPAGVTQPAPLRLERYAWLSIAAAVATILLKGTAWWLTGSVGLLSDAIESFVNLAGALMALWMLILAASPADESHAYGHSKAEYFSSAFEGFLILLAALSIAYTAIVRMLHPLPLDAVGLGLLVSVAASVINFLTARTLLRVGKKHDSISLEADAQHLMTDVWTSVGVIAGVGLDQAGAACRQTRPTKNKALIARSGP